MSNDQTKQMPRFWGVWLRDDLSVWEITPSDDVPDVLDSFIQTETCGTNRRGWRGWVQAPDAEGAIAQAKASVQAAITRQVSMRLNRWSRTP